MNPTGKVFVENISLLIVNMLVFCISLVLGSVVGALAGWLVGLCYGNTILGIFAVFGIKGFAMWQIGCFLGFLRSVFTSNFLTRNVSADNLD